MTRARRSFTDEFKREAVKLYKQPGASRWIPPEKRDILVPVVVLYLLAYLNT